MIRRVSRARGSHASSSHSAERKKKRKMFTLLRGRGGGDGRKESVRIRTDDARVARVLPQHRISKGARRKRPMTKYRIEISTTNNYCSLVRRIYLIAEPQTHTREDFL